LICHLKNALKDALATQLVVVLSIIPLIGMVADATIFSLVLILRPGLYKDGIVDNTLPQNAIQK